MLKKIAMGIGAIILLILIIPMFMSSNYHVERSIEIEKPVDLVYKTVTNFKTWSQWDAWTKLDPNASHTYSDEMGVVGSFHHWNGNDKMGEGKMVIDELVENTSMKSTITFMRPWESSSDIGMTFTETENGTNVSWTMSGENPYLMRYMNGMIETGIAKDYEEGLANLKALVEKMEPEMTEADSNATSIATDTEPAKTNE